MWVRSLNKRLGNKPLGNKPLGNKPLGNKPPASSSGARAELLGRLGYDFSDTALLDAALSHSSIEPIANNERLEFLGDRVIGLVIADALFGLAPDASEGQLSRRYSDCVDNRQLAKIARGIGLGGCLSVQLGTDLANQDKVLADALEALLGAIWRDGGMDAARPVIMGIWADLITSSARSEIKDSKTLLQEYAHRQHLPLPAYAIIGRGGTEHRPIFTIEVTCGNRTAKAVGSSKQLAEKLAAAAWLEGV